MTPAERSATVASVRARGHGRSACATLALFAALELAGCAREIDDLGTEGRAVVDDGGMTQMDGGLFGNADPNAQPRFDAGRYSRDAEVTADAFFINDPPPPYCGPDGEMRPTEPPGGTPECPDDKNREGCPCPEAGATAACWPGQRVNRHHGNCKDGTTTCIDTTEFGLRWGPCEGYELPDETVLAGPRSCRCFSSGTWTIDNLVPCMHRAPSGNAYLYSSIPGASGIDCGSNIPEPPPLPRADWSENRIQVDCAGEFELCVTLKAGPIQDPQPDDCVVMRHCIPVSYGEANAVQELPRIPAWVSSDPACAGRFSPADGVGYAEMSVFGRSVECDVVDDGRGNPYVFHRTNYCPPSCAATPDTPECRDCRMGGSGMFE
jgi:hypothetical protein